MVSRSVSSFVVLLLYLCRSLDRRRRVVCFAASRKVASRVLTAEEGLRFSKAQLEVMKTEFAATSAQLSAVQTELAQQKAG